MHKYYSHKHNTLPAMGTDRVYLKSCFSSYGFAGKYDFPCYGILRAMGTKAIYKIELCQNEKYIK